MNDISLFLWNIRFQNQGEANLVTSRSLCQLLRLYVVVCMCIYYRPYVCIYMYVCMYACVSVSVFLRSAVVANVTFSVRRLELCIRRCIHVHVKMCLPLCVCYLRTAVASVR